MSPHSPTLADPSLLGPAFLDAFRKLDPRVQFKNPVMFVTFIGAILTTLSLHEAGDSSRFIGQLAAWLWFTVLFANFAEAVAEGRGKAQANTLR